jgi:enterobacterial common antigen flippase
MSLHTPNTAVAEPLLQDMEQPEDQPKAVKNTYGQILKSTALIGGSQVVNIAIGIIRTKAMAVLLGPSGFGLMGLYSSIADFAQSIAGLGVNSSGVRQIAEAVGTGDTDRIARTATVLRRISVLLGILGALILVAFSRLASLLTFGDERHTVGIVILSVAVFFRLVSLGQGALIQGMRRISDLAKMGVLGALLGTIVTIPLVYYFREEGVVPSLVAVGAMSLITSWWYSRKIQVRRPAMTISQIRLETSSLLKLGFAFMASGFLMMGAAYAVRTIVLRMVGFEGAGFYQAAWTLGGLYVGFILQAMGADFYPRLTAVSKDDAECNRLVNEQAQISLLLAGPGVVATLILAPLVITLLYSSKFNGAVEILRWICLGMTLRVITWPMGFVIMAKGESNIFFWTELAWTIVNVGLSWIFVKSFGLNGAGIAFFGSYIFHGLMIYPIVHGMSGFRWSPENMQTGFVFLFVVAVAFCSCFFLPFWYAFPIGLIALVSSSVYSIRRLLRLIPVERIPQPLRRLLELLSFARHNSKG